MNDFGGEFWLAFFTAITVLFFYIYSFFESNKENNTDISSVKENIFFAYFIALYMGLSIVWGVIFWINPVFILNSDLGLVSFLIFLLVGYTGIKKISDQPVYLISSFMLMSSFMLTGCVS